MERSSSCCLFLERQQICTVYKRAEIDSTYLYILSLYVLFIWHCSACSRGRAPPKALEVCEGAVCPAALLWLLGDPARCQIESLNSVLKTCQSLTVCLTLCLKIPTAFTTDQEIIYSVIKEFHICLWASPQADILKLKVLRGSWPLV